MYSILLFSDIQCLPGDLKSNDDRILKKVKEASMVTMNSEK